MQDQRKVIDILNKLDNTLKTAYYGLTDLQNHRDDRKIAGLRNLVVFGRAVTNVLQNLRSIDSYFDQWYQDYVKEMSSDELMKYFYKIRSEILKQGELRVTNVTTINSFNFPEDLMKFGSPPPNARSFFIGDKFGNSGWEVELPDGSIEKYYVEIPSEIGVNKLIFSDSPKMHLGQKIDDDSIENLGRLYFEYLDRMVREAKEIY